MERPLDRGWDPILSQGGVGSIYNQPPPLISDRPMWCWDFHTVWIGINPGDIRVRPRVLGVVDVWIDSDPGMGGPIVSEWRKCTSLGQ